MASNFFDQLFKWWYSMGGLFSSSNQGSSSQIDIAPTRRMRAVCIGWNVVDPNVPEYDGWDGELPSCELDANNLAALWISHNIPTKVLLTKDATIEKCKQALKESLEDLREGDWLIVSVSGHGGQTRDYSGDEKDGLDEYLCAYDGPVLDDTIHEWLQYVPKGVCVLWLCDTCHSGDMARSAPPVKFRSRAIPKSFEGQLILISGCTEAGTSQDTGEGGVLTNTLLSTSPEGKTPKNWALAVQNEIPKYVQQPQYVEYNVSDSFRNATIVV